MYKDFHFESSFRKSPSTPTVNAGHSIFYDSSQTFLMTGIHNKIHGMAGKQCAFSAKRLGERSLFSKTLAGISTLTQWILWDGSKRKYKYSFTNIYVLVWIGS